MRRTRVIVAILAALVLMSACEPESGERTDSGLPKRNPVTPAPPRVTGVKTPGPIAGDPKPENKRAVYLRVACAPLDEYVEIDWQAGPAHGGHIREKKCFPAWEREVEVWHPATITFSARWTEISFRDMTRKSTGGSIELLVTINKEIKCSAGTPLVASPIPRGTSCPTIRT